MNTNIDTEILIRNHSLADVLRVLESFSVVPTDVRPRGDEGEAPTARPERQALGVS